MKRVLLSNLVMLSCLLLPGLGVCRAVFAQASLDELEKRLEALPKTPVGPAPVGPAGAAAEPGYLGLVGGDTLVENGVQVVAVSGGGPAARAGVAENDVITAINGAPIRNLDDMGRMLDSAAAGQEIELELLKGERKVKVRATLSRRPGAKPSPLVIESRPTLGATVTPLTPALREKFRLGVASGAVVDTVQEGSPAAAAGLVPGAAIVALDGRRIDTPEQLAASLAALAIGQEVELAFYVGGDLHREKARLAAATPAGFAGDVPRDDASPERREVARPAFDSPAEELTALRRELAELQAQMAELQRRLEAAEARLPK
ncbi:MAG: PDZ domain-containing protein [Pirellulaceae bacterium]